MKTSLAFDDENHESFEAQFAQHMQQRNEIFGHATNSLSETLARTSRVMRNLLVFPTLR